jgi:hypothetical protein
LEKYYQQKDVFDMFEVDVPKCVVVEGCFDTNKFTIQRQMIPESKGEFSEYPTNSNMEMFDESVRVVLRKLKNLYGVRAREFEDVYMSELSPDKKPGFRYEEVFKQRTKGEAINSALDIAKERWKYLESTPPKEIKRKHLKAGVYTIGARNKRDAHYDDDEVATSRAVHMPELHAELTSAPWAEAVTDKVKEVGRGPLYIGNSFLEYERLQKDIEYSYFVLEGDWKRFDSTLYIKIITAAVGVFRCLFENNKHVDRHIIGMYDSLAIKDYYVPGGNVFRLFHGLPSGVKSTSILGSIVNLIALVYSVGPEFCKDFNFIVGGDDFLISCMSEKYDAESVSDSIQARAEELGMHLKFLKIKHYNAEKLSDNPTFYKYTVYKNEPVVPTEAMLERVFMPWNKKYGNDYKLYRFLIDVMPSLGKPMSHLYMYYNFLSRRFIFV